VSCHQIEQTQALFTDNRFHNIGVGFKNIRGKENTIAQEYLKAKHVGADVDKTVLADPDASELGRFAVSENITEVGAFKTASPRNITLTAPCMHDGSQKTLEDMVNVYNNGGRVKEDDPFSPFLRRHPSTAPLGPAEEGPGRVSQGVDQPRDCQTGGPHRDHSDFIFYGGDIAQRGKPEEIDHGLEILGGLRGKVYYVMGEHDYYVDLGEYWRDQLGPDHYSFDHKGVHFAVLNSILIYDDWMYGDWEKPMDRMIQMARFDNPKGSPFMVGESQRRWLEKDLKGVSRETPVVVFSHSALQIRSRKATWRSSPSQ